MFTAIRSRRFEIQVGQHDYTLEPRSHALKSWKYHQKSASCPSEQTSAGSALEEDGEELDVGNFIDGATEEADLLNYLLEKHLHPAVWTWKCSPTQWRFELHQLSLGLCFESAKGITVYAESDILPRKHLDPLRQALRVIVGEHLHHPSWNAWKFGVLLLQMCEEAVGRLQNFDRTLRQEVQAWDAQKAQNWDELILNDFGVDLLSVNDTAQHLLGQPITDICDGISDWFRIIHVEPVFRSDQASRFLRRRRDIREELLKLDYGRLRQLVTKKQIRSREVVDSVDGIAEHLSQPHVTFHGTQTRALESIVRYGFIVPGQAIGRTGEDLAINCGSSYGVGIYSSPDPFFCLSYTDYLDGTTRARSARDIAGFRLIVCATLMGRSLEVSRSQTRGTEAVFKASAHSHVSPNGKEYVVFDSAQIIPCYVLTLDLGAESAKMILDRVAEDPYEWKASIKKSRIINEDFAADDTSPGAVQAKKRALKAAATKWFPYGYGSATGTNFVIEEIGDVEDDEEEYGDLQSLRYAAKEDLHEGHRPADEHESWFDQYQTVRSTKAEVRMDRLGETGW